MNTDMIQAMPQGDSASLFQVIQGGGNSPEMKALEGVFQEVLGYTTEQMEEMQAAFDAQGDLESPMEKLEEWMQGLQDLLSELGVQLESEGFKMNAKAFAQNIIQVEGEEIQSFEDLQKLLAESAEDAEIPVFIQTQLKLQIEISSNTMRSEQDSEGVNQRIQMAHFQMQSQNAEGVKEFQTLRMSFRQLAFQAQSENGSQIVDGENSIAHPFKALQGLMKQLLARIEQVENVVAQSMNPDQSDTWAINAAELGFNEDEIQLLANMKNLMPADQELSPQDALNQNYIAFSMTNESSDEESQETVSEEALIASGVAQSVNPRLTSTENRLGDTHQISPKGELSPQDSESNLNSVLSQEADAKNFDRNPKEESKESPKQAAQALKNIPVPMTAEATSLPDEQTWTQIKTDNKGDLIIEKITQATGSNAPKHPVVRQIETQVSVMFDKGESRTTLSLYPENLGKVDLEITISQDKMQLMVSVENDKVKGILEQNIQQLKDSLAQHNLHLDKSEVNIEYKNAGHQQQNDGKRKGFHNKGSQDTILTVELEAREGDETGRRLGYNTLEYLA